MKLQDMAKKTNIELAELIVTTRTDLAKAAIDSRTKEVRDVKLQGRLKQTIARALTIQREREIANEEAAS